MTQTPTAKPPHGNRIALVLIFAIPVVVILASTFLYYLADSKVVDLGTANRGQLITPPLEIATLKLRDGSGQPLDYSQPKPRWSYLMFGGKRCEGMCERILFLTGQTHKLLGKKIDKVQRIYVGLDGDVDESLQQVIDEQSRSLKLAYADRDAVTKALSKLDSNPLADNALFLVDPDGWLMMYYVAENTGQLTLSQLSKDMIKDIKRLIP
jgi:cytochrome oxidase Cu insertion factor (SCO1/SenC/PrrC family)